jgi:hypothetical protein
MKNSQDRSKAFQPRALSYRDLLMTKSNGFAAATESGFSNVLQTMRTNNGSGAKTVRALRSLTAAPSGRTSMAQE